MIIRNAYLTYPRAATFTCNASWITIETKRGTIRRDPTKGPWYDPKHRAVVDALRALEKAIDEMLDEEVGE